MNIYRMIPRANGRYGLFEVYSARKFWLGKIPESTHFIEEVSDEKEARKIIANLERPNIEIERQ